MLTEAPEHLWRFYDQWAHYCHVDSYDRKTVVASRSRLYQLLIETGANLGTVTNHGRSSLVVVDSIYTTRCALDRLLVLVTTGHFTQSFVVEFKAPRSFVVVGSIVRYKPADDATSVNHRSLIRWEDEHDGNGDCHDGGVQQKSMTCSKVVYKSVDNQLFVGFEHV